MFICWDTYFYNDTYFSVSFRISCHSRVLLELRIIIDIRFFYVQTKFRELLWFSKISAGWNLWHLWKNEQGLSSHQSVLTTHQIKTTLMWLVHYHHNTLIQCSIVTRKSPGWTGKREIQIADGTTFQRKVRSHFIRRNEGWSVGSIAVKSTDNSRETAVSSHSGL